MILLDWTDPSHWNGGRREPCRLCGHPAFLLDDAGDPAHKLCVEAALDALTERTTP